MKNFVHKLIGYEGCDWRPTLVRLIDHLMQVNYVLKIVSNGLNKKIKSIGIAKSFLNFYQVIGWMTIRKSFNKQTTRWKD